VQFDSTREAAVSLLSNRNVHDAFSLEKVDPKMLDRYGRHSFGWSLLMAKRLVETGVRLVQVNLGNNESWDTHQAAWKNLKGYLLPPMDQAVSALIEDLDASGQLEDTLIIVGSEFGRTPKIKSISAQPFRAEITGARCKASSSQAEASKVAASSAPRTRSAAIPPATPKRPKISPPPSTRALGLPRDLMWHDFTNRPHTLYMGSPISGLT
jgi:hypothetical protein